MVRFHVLLLVLIASVSFSARLPAQKRITARFDAVGDPLPAQALHRFGTARFCTQSEVVALTLSHDGKLLAAVDREGRVYLWETDGGKQGFVTRPDSGKRVVISPDGQWLALGEDAPFEVRNLKKDMAPRLPIGNGPRVFAFTPESTAIAMSMMDEADIVVFDIESGKELRRFAGLEGMVGAIAFSPDGKRIAAAAVPISDDKENPVTIVNIAVWNAQTSKKLKHWEHKAKLVRKLVFLPDNKTLVGQFSTRLDAWDSTTGAHIDKIAHNVGSAFTLDAAAKTLATTDGPKVMNFATGDELHDFDKETVLRHIAMSGDGKLLVASPARFSASSPRLLMWDLTTGKERNIAEEHRHFVDAVIFSHDGRLIATASNIEGVARVWDAQSAKLLHALNIESLAARKSGGPRIRSTLNDGLAFSPTAAELFVAGQRWDLKAGQPIPLDADDDFKFEQTNSYRAVMAPDGRLAGSFLTGHAILFWDPAKGKAVQTIEPDKKARGSWSSLAFSPNGKLAATGKLIPRPKSDEDSPYEETVYVWDIAAGKLVKKFRARPGHVVRLMFSPDGETLAVISLPTKLELWHLPTGRLLREMSLLEDGELPRVFSLPTVAFAPHGHWLAFTHQPGEIALLETHTAKQILALRGHQGYVSSLAFSPDNRRLLTGGRDTTALLWSVLPESPALPPAWQDPQKLWLDLGGVPDQAYRIAWALMAHPDRALDVLKKRLQPDRGASDKEINELITNLASPKFTQREPAIRRLKEIGTRALPLLEQALKKAPDLETTRRIQELLRTVETALTPEALRDLRGLQILEMIGTPAARELLLEVAQGDPGAAKTKLAQAALARGKAN
jgi:WD40 repeat protein